MVLTVGISGGNWIEIAYGTESGVVRIIVQHPETVYAAGHGPQLFQTFTVHRSPVVKVMLSEKHLISGIACKTCFTLLYLLRFSLLLWIFYGSFHRDHSPKTFSTTILLFPCTNHKLKRTVDKNHPCKTVFYFKARLLEDRYDIWDEQFKVSLVMNLR